MDLKHKLTGVAASDGVAVGPVYVHDPGELKPERPTIPEAAVEEELRRFDAAVEAVVPKLSETAEKLRVTELSMSAPSIPRAKKVLSET